MCLRARTEQGACHRARPPPERVAGTLASMTKKIVKDSTNGTVKGGCGVDMLGVPGCVVLIFSRCYGSSSQVRVGVDPARARYGRQRAPITTATVGAARAAFGRLPEPPWVAITARASGRMGTSIQPSKAAPPRRPDRSEGALGLRRTREFGDRARPGPVASGRARSCPAPARGRRSGRQPSRARWRAGCSRA